MKLCECGCGKAAPIATITNTKHGAVEGQPQRFVHGHNSKVNHPNARPLLERFWEKVNKKGPLPKAGAVTIHPSIKGTPCWVWTGGSNAKGYGTFRAEGNPVAAHRVGWFIAYGKYPSDQCLHKCDNPPCVRPSHLFEGSNAINNADKMAKGRNVQVKGEAHGLAKLTSAKVTEIRRRFSAGESMKDLAQAFNTVRGNIFNIVRRINWKHI